MVQNKVFAKKKTSIIRKYWWQISLIGFIIGFIVLINLNQQNQANYINKDIKLPEAYNDFDADIPEDYSEWTTITTQENDTLAKIFSSLVISQKTLLEILENNPYAKNLVNIKPNQQLRFLIKNHQLEKVIFPYSTTELLTVSRNDDKYVTQLESRVIDVHNDFLATTVKKSLYATAKTQKIPFTLIQQMAKIFEWEVDFTKDIREGDSFNILYETFYVDDTKINTGNIIAVEFKNKNRTLQAIAHPNANGELEYYTPSGASLKKAFSRYPVKFSHISSSFSLARKHPILNYVRPHKGIDLAARLGTPIYATGDGYIKTIGINSGYGNMIKIVHNKTYMSVYAHLSRFQKGLKRGDHVQRGQVIGYVGQTGLATAPHCHYEFHVNQRAQNPATIKLPQAKSVAAKDLASFNFKANQLLASLKLYAESSVAQAETPKKETNTG